MDWRLHPCFTLHFPTDVDLKTRITTNLAHPLSTENASKKCNSPPQTFLLLIISSLAVIFRSLLFHIIHICAFYFVFEIVYTPVLPSHTLSLLSLFCVSFEKHSRVPRGCISSPSLLLSSCVPAIQIIPNMAS